VRAILTITGVLLAALALVWTLADKMRPGAPRGAGQCWQRVAASPPKWTMVADQSKSIEACGGYLEAIRTQTLKVEEVIGGYQGFFVIARPQGIYYTTDLKKFPIRALVRTDDGKLAPPGQVTECYDGRGETARPAGKLKLGSCIEKLFDKVCLAPGEVRYGGWDSNTIRLIDGRVEQAGRDLVFRPLVTQQPGCRLPIAD
jgi:hypothetical protein